MEDNKAGRYEPLNSQDWRAWLESEISYWSNILDNLPDDDIDNKYSLLEYLKALKAHYNTGVTFGNLSEILENFDLPTHDFDPTQKLQHEAKNGNLTSALFGFRLITKQASLEYSRQSQLAANFKNSADSFKDSIKLSIDAQAADLIDKLNTKETDAINAITEAMKTIIHGGREELTTTLKAATDAIFSAEPVKYWDKRTLAHKKNAENYKKWLIRCGVLFTIILGMLIYTGYSNGEPFKIGSLTLKIPSGLFLPLLVLLTTGAIWLIRILVKLMMTNLSLEIECLERSTMIKTYLAISGTDSTTLPEVRTLFYSSLFRPTSISLTDDSTSPEYIKILEVLLKTEKGKPPAN